MKTRLLSLTGVLVVLAVVSLRADTITLTDGRVIQGHLNRRGNNYVIQPDHGAAFVVPVKDLAAIELGGPVTPAQAAQNAFKSLEYRINRQTSLAAIIKSITAFAARYPHSALMAKAQAQLIQYKQYQSLGFIRFAGKWMAPGQAKIMIAQAAAGAETALADYKAGNFQTARTAALAAVKINPANADAMIILGALDYRAGNLPGAARHFSAVLSGHKKNVIAINDMAITVYHQRQQPRALVYYRKALNRAGGNRLLLDNIFIALNHYSGNHRAMLYENLSKMFSLADVKMRAAMAKRGLYRLGGTWVPLAIHKKMSAEMAAYEKRKNVLQAQYDSARLYLRGVQQQIQQVIAQINSLNTSIGYLEVQENYSYLQTGYSDLNYQALISGYMAQLASAQAQRTKLRGREISTITTLKQMRLQAKLLEQSAPAHVLMVHQRIMLPGDLTHVPPPAPLRVAGPHLQLK